MAVETLMDRRVRFGTILMMVVISYGTLGFHWVSQVPWLLSLYYTVAVMSTVSDPGISPKTPEAVLFTTVLVIVGTMGWIFWVSLLVSVIVETDLGAFQEKRWKRRVMRMKGHFIVLGAGQVGHSIASELRDQGETVVVADTDRERVTRMIHEGYMAFHIERLDQDGGETVNLASARGLALALPDDAQNLYAYLSARDVNPNILVVARAQTPQAAHYLNTLGVERVILPDVVSGRRLAHMLVKPVAHDLLMAILNEEGVQLTEVLVSEGSQMANQPVGQVRQIFGHDVTLIGYWREGLTHMGPKAQDVIKPGDTLILVQSDR